MAETEEKPKRSSFKAEEVEVSVVEEQAAASKNGKGKQLITAVKTMCTPRMFLYLPKSVNVGNERLGFVYIFLLVVSFVAIIVFTLLPQNNSIEVKADIKVSVCDEGCQIRADEMDRLVTQGLTQSYCTGGSKYATSAEKGGTYFSSGSSCARRCGNANGSSACLYPFELSEVTGEEAFIPTFFRETFVKPDESGACDVSAGYTFQNSRCEKVQDFYVTGADDLKVSFSQHFSVLPHYNTLSFGSPSAATQAHSGSFHAKGWDEGMLTVLLSPSGKVLKRFTKSKYSEIAVKDLFSAAHSSFKGSLGLDSIYQRADMGMTDSLPIRLTGASVTIDVFVTSHGICKIFSKDASTEVEQVKVDWKGPLACLTVNVDPRWVSRAVVQPLGLAGSRAREKNGIHIKFRKMGFFTFVDEQSLLRSFTAALMWLKLPLIITYMFAILALGNLSQLYAHLTQVEVNAADACKGFSMRLLTYSSAFMDLRGKTGEDEGSDGITRRCVAERIGAITRDMEVEPSVLSKMIDVIYDSFKAYKKPNAPDSDVVTCQEYCVACSNNEPITLETLVKIFDKDRPLGFFESIFLDKALAKVREAAMREAEEVQAAFQADEGVSDPDAAHSYIVQAYRDVQFMMKDLNRIEELALQTAKDLDVNPSTLGLVAKSSVGNASGAAAGTVLPKLKQSVSSDSIGDEGDATKRDFRDIER